MPPVSKRVLRRFIIAGACVLALGVVLCYLAGSWLVAPAPRNVGSPPVDFQCEAVELETEGGLKTEAGLKVRGWYACGEPGRGIVLLLHGIHGSRRSMMGRARFLRQRGYSTLLIDLHAHGESDGSRITFGLSESDSVVAAIRYLRSRAPNERIGAIGSSLGGAACLLADAPLDIDALVVEAVYPTIEEAVSGRLGKRFGVLGRFGAPLLLWQLPLRLGVSSPQLRPLDRIGRHKVPMFVVGGMLDRSTTPDETRRLFDAAAEPKALWLIDGVGHVDFHAAVGKEYQTRVSEFLETYMR